MRISIAMCTYNGAQYLQKQLDTFASQSHPPCELIVCDDGSTDATLALIESFAAQATFPVRIYKNERNLGSTRNFQKAIALCEGDLIALSDQDDEWYPNKLAEMHRLFEEFPKALAAFSDADVIDERSAPVGRKLWKSLFFTPAKYTPHVDAGIVSTLFKLNYIATGATMVFRSDFRSQFIPIPDSWVHDAWISWIAALRGGLAPYPAATIRYRIHTQQQIGLAPPSLSEHVAVARKNEAYFRTAATRLKDLRLYLEQHKDDNQLANFIPELDAKIRHIEGRASLTGSALHRARWILRQWRQYQRYARGPIAMLSDAFIVSGKKAPGNAGQNA
jgi:glycosyltransferase involved in cell wall biosynthesis